MPDTGSVTASSSLVLKFKLNSAYFKPDSSGNIHQECEINWSCVDAAGNSNENTATTTIRIYDTTTPQIDTSGTIYEDANSQSVSDGQRKTQISIALPRISDNVSNGLGDGSGGTIRLEYKIFDHTWSSSFGWEADDKLATISDNKSVGTNITSPLNINFVLSAANIHTIREAKIAEDDTSDPKYENFYIAWKATDNADNYYVTEQVVQIKDVTAPTLTVDHISVPAASDNHVNTLEIILPGLTDNLSNAFGLQSEGNIKLDYKIFNYDWDDSNGVDNFDSDSKLADADPNTGIDISGAFYVDFTLSGENIFAIKSNYENFYIYWKATDSANNISYKNKKSKSLMILLLF